MLCMIRTASLKSKRPRPRSIWKNALHRLIKAASEKIHKMFKFSMAKRNIVENSRILDYELKSDSQLENRFLA